jgi:polyhydroxyalkanoate synthesis regulator protein
MARRFMHVCREALDFWRYDPDAAARHETQSRLLRLILETQRSIAMDVSKIKADIAAQSTVLQGAVKLIQGLTATNADQSKQIADLKAALANAGTSDASVQSALDALDESIQSNSALISSAMPALTQNTDTPPAQAQDAAAAASAPA